MELNPHSNVMHTKDGSEDLSNGKRYLTIQELAGYMGVSRWSLYKLVQRRRIPFITLAIEEDGPSGKGIVRFDVREIDKWLRKKSVTPLN